MDSVFATSLRNSTSTERMTSKLWRSTARRIASAMLSDADILNRLNDQVKKNGGFLVGGKMSYADIQCAALNRYLSNQIGYDLHKNHPELKKLVDRVLSNSNVKAYLDKCPKTDS